MNNAPPLSEGGLSTTWANWFAQVWQCLPWKRGSNVTADLNFGSISAQSQLTLTVTVAGARVGDAVQVTTADVSGLVFTGAVTAANTVSISAKNFSAAPINPAAQSFRIIVLQN